MPSSSSSTGIRVKKSRRRSESESFDLKACCGLSVLIIALCCIVVGPPMILYETIRAVLPTCSIDEFYVAALNKSVVSINTSDTIFFKISFEDENIFKGVQYSQVNLTFFYGSDSYFPVGNYVVPSFYQASVQKGGSSYFPIVKSDVVRTYGVPWEAARDLITNGSTVSFRVGLDATVRFKYLDMFLNKKRKLAVGAVLKVDDSGKKIGKSVQLKSGASPSSARRNIQVVLTVAVFITFYLMNV